MVQAHGTMSLEEITLAEKLKPFQALARSGPSKITPVHKQEFLAILNEHGANLDDYFVCSDCSVMVTNYRGKGDPPVNPQLITGHMRTVFGSNPDSHPCFWQCTPHAVDFYLRGLAGFKDGKQGDAVTEGTLAGLQLSKRQFLIVPKGQEFDDLEGLSAKLQQAGKWQDYRVIPFEEMAPIVSASGMAFQTTTWQVIVFFDRGKYLSQEQRLAALAEIQNLSMSEFEKGVAAALDTAKKGPPIVEAPTGPDLYGPANPSGRSIETIVGGQVVEYRVFVLPEPVEHPAFVNRVLTDSMQFGYEVNPDNRREVRFFESDQFPFMDNTEAGRRARAYAVAGILSHDFRARGLTPEQAIARVKQLGFGVPPLDDKSLSELFKAFSAEGSRARYGSRAAPPQPGTSA